MWTWALFAVSVFGAWLAGQNPRLGWWFTILIELVAWAPYAVLTGQPGLVAMAGVYALLGARNLYRWRGTPFVPAVRSRAAQLPATAKR